MAGGARLSAVDRMRASQAASAKAWIEKYLPLSIQAAAGNHPTPRASAASDSMLYL